MERERQRERQKTRYLFECDSHPSDGVVVGSPLKRGEHSEVDPVLQVILDLPPLLVHRTHALTVEDQTSPGGERARQVSLEFRLTHMQLNTFMDKQTVTK